MIMPAQIFELAVRPPAHKVAAAVQPLAIAKRRRHKPLRRQPGTAKITPRKPGTADVKLARHPDRSRLAMAVQHIDLRVRDRTADRNQRAVDPPSAHQ